MISSRISILIEAYISGFFPMADKSNNISEEINFYSPYVRAIFPLYDIKPHKSFRQFIKQNPMDITINKDFSFVINACANRESTWISKQIIKDYILLHQFGFAHSIETWYNGEIVGGLYGVSIGGAFFGESMFSLITNASKAAFYYLIEYLKLKKFELLDSQFINEHTKLLGAIEIPRENYLKLLKNAIKLKRNFI